MRSWTQRSKRAPSWLTCGLRALRRGTTLVAFSAIAACRSRNVPQELSQPASEPEQFRFTLPVNFVTLELRGEGSETLRAPAGAGVMRIENGFRVAAGSDFSVDVMLDAPSLTEVPAAPGVARVLNESDLVVFKSPSAGYSFVLSRELVPEWDDDQRERMWCGSSGGAVSQAPTSADARGFSKEATQAMVAACRTLELPKLE